MELYELCKPFTMTSLERLYALYQATRYIVTKGIAGDFVECGVWRGGSMMLCAYLLNKAGATDRQLYLYDTYAGMSEPTEVDVSIHHESARDEWQSAQQNQITDWCFASLSEVRDNMRRTGYPEDNIQLVQGKVEETIPSQAPTRIALLRLDTDWYESTRHELRHLYPRLEPSGVLIIDDYGYWQGARQATDEYFAEAGAPVLLNRIDETGRLVVKT